MEKYKRLGVMLQYDGKTVDEILDNTKHRFVCSDVHLASFNEQATGPVLSAREAYETFGFKKIDEVFWYGSAIVEPEKTLMFRQRKNLTDKGS